MREERRKIGWHNNKNWREKTKKKEERMRCWEYIAAPITMNWIQRHQEKPPQ
jgi:hypothetical protein